MYYSLPRSRLVGKATAQAVTRHNEKLNEPNRLYDQVVEAFEMGNHTTRILDGWLRGKRAIVHLREANGWVTCYVVVNGKMQFQRLITVGYLDPETGWQLSNDFTLQSFNLWHLRARREIQKLEDKGAI